MQKKPYEQEPSSWQSNAGREQRNDLVKKIIIWGGIALASIAGIALLVKLAGTSSSTAPIETPNLPEVSANEIIVGEKNAKVSIIEYSDFQCPACASYNPVVNKLLSDYSGKVRLVYRFFPLRTIHKNGIISSQAGYAAWKLGKFSEMKDELFVNQKDWESLDEGKAKEAFIDYAKGLKLDGNKFKEIMNSNEAKNAVLDGEKEALGLGLNSTPTFFLGNKRVQPGGYEDFKKLIDDELIGQKPLQ